MVWMRKEGDWGEEGHWSLVFRKLWGADGLFFFYSTHRETAVNAGTEVLRGHGIVPFVPFFSEAEPWTREQALQWQQLPHHSAKMIKEQMSPCHSLQAPSLHLYTHIIQPLPPHQNSRETAKRKRWRLRWKLKNRRERLEQRSCQKAGDRVGGSGVVCRTLITLTNDVGSSSI